MIILFKNSVTCISSWARKYEFNLNTIIEMTLALSAGKCIYINSCFMWAVYKWFANFFPNITFLHLLTDITRFIKRVICRCLQILFHIWHFMHVSTFIYILQPRNESNLFPFFSILFLITYLNFVWYQHSYCNGLQSITVFANSVFATFNIKRGFNGNTIV